MKIKFEKLPFNHHAQNLNEKILWNEALSREIPRENWEDFIVKEMNISPSINTIYYSKANKSKKKLGGFNTIKTINEIIQEEA